LKLVDRGCQVCLVYARFRPGSDVFTAPLHVTGFCAQALRVLAEVFGVLDESKRTPREFLRVFGIR
jgi:hypothetical protein